MAGDGKDALGTAAIAEANFLQAWCHPRAGWVSAALAVPGKNGHSRCCLYGIHGGYLLNNRITFLLLQIKPLSCWGKTRGVFYSPLSLHLRCTGSRCPTLCIESWWKHKVKSPTEKQLGRCWMQCRPCWSNSCGTEHLYLAGREQSGTTPYDKSLLLYCKIHEQLNTKELNSNIHFI